MKEGNHVQADKIKLSHDIELEPTESLDHHQKTYPIGKEGTIAKLSRTNSIII